VPTFNSFRNELLIRRSRLSGNALGGYEWIDIMPNLERIIPVLTYQGIAAAHDFLVRAFGFNGAGVQRNAEGQAIHGEVRAGNTTIWLHRVMAEHQLDSPQVSDVANSGLFVYVDDVDAHYEQARMAGARIDSQPVDQPYGQREYGARDLEGHR
jgi:MerR family transcriptional regulator, thiopeptide resistance regulator